MIGGTETALPKSGSAVAVVDTARSESASRNGTGSLLGALLRAYESTRSTTDSSVNGVLLGPGTMTTVRVTDPTGRTSPGGDDRHQPNSIAAL